MRSDLTICKQNNYLHEKQHLCIKYIFWQNQGQNAAWLVSHAMGERRSSDPS